MSLDGSCLAIGCTDGNVLVLRFDNEIKERSTEDYFSFF